MRKLILIVILVVLFGCQPQQQIQVVPERTKVWGQGDLPPKWQEFFGNDNLSRFNFVQTQRINKTAQTLAGLSERVSKLEEQIDVNDVVIP